MTYAHISGGIGSLCGRSMCTGLREDSTSLNPVLEAPHQSWSSPVLSWRKSFSLEGMLEFRGKHHIADHLLLWLLDSLNLRVSNTDVHQWLRSIWQQVLYSQQGNHFLSEHTVSTYWFCCVWNITCPISSERYELNPFRTRSIPLLAWYVLQLWINLSRIVDWKEK